VECLRSTDINQLQLQRPTYFVQTTLPHFKRRTDL
jgi:hypothetical protein